MKSILIKIHLVALLLSCGLVEWGHSQTIEIENMPFKSSGYQSGNGWVLDVNGFVSDSAEFSTSGRYQFKIRAKGNKGDNDWPFIELHIDDLVCGPIKVNQTNEIDYTAYSDVLSGIHEISLHYINDSGPRSVTLDKITISSIQFDDEDLFLTLADIVLQRFPEPATYSIRSWVYEELMWGVAKAWELTGDVKYLNYVKSYMDHHIDDNGNLDIEINDTIPGIIIAWLYLQTHEQKYLIAARKIGNYILTEYPRTSDGGFVHHAWLQDQLWDDTMGGLGRLLGMLGQITGEDRYFDEGLLQFQVHASHLQDRNTGLFYHAYDEDRSADWSNPFTGTSPEFWGRGNGWIIRGLADFLEYLPPNHQGREELIQLYQNFVQGLTEYQDVKSGLWHTVVDKIENADNYLETSGSMLISYGLLKGKNLGILPARFEQNAEMVNQGLLRKIYKKNAKIYVTGISAATGPGDYQNYVSKPIGTGEDYPYGDGIYLQQKAESVKSSKSSSYAISGTVRYHLNQVPVPRVLISISGDLNNNFLTDDIGAFLFDNIPPNISCTITPVKTSDEDVNEYDITAYDAALAAQAAVQLRTLSSMEQIAADVSKDGVIQTYDAALIARYAVGLPKLAGSHVGEWVFEPSNYSYQNIEKSYYNQDFHAILLGNVYGDWQPGGLKKQIPIEKFPLALKFKNVKNDVTIFIPSPYKKEIFSVDLEVSFNPNQLALIEVKKPNNEIRNFYYNVENGRIKACIFSAEPIEFSENILILKFSRQTSTKDLNVFLEKLVINGKLQYVGTAESHFALDNTSVNDFYLSPGYPNPFLIAGAGRKLQIEYKLPAQGNVRISIYNINGQHIKTLVRAVKEQGRHTIFWDGKNNYDEFVGSGVYFCQLNSNGANLVRKIVVVR